MTNPLYTRLFLDGWNLLPDNSILSFDSLIAVENYFGTGSKEAVMAQDYFTGPYADEATMLFTRIGLGQRPHLIGGAVNPADLSSIDGSLSIQFDGFTYSGNVNLKGVTTVQEAALDVRKAFHHLPIASTTINSWIQPETIHFEASLTKGVDITEASGQPPLVVGGLISGAGVTDNHYSNQIIYEHNGYYTTGAGSGSAPMEEMTETYGILHVGSVTSGTFAAGQRVSGTGVMPLTAVISSLGNNEWIVNNAQTIGSEEIDTTAPSLTVEGITITGATANRNFLEVQPGIEFGFDANPSDLSFASGTAAAGLGLTQASGGLDASPGGQHPSVAQFMSQVMSEDSAWSSFQSIEPRLSTQFEDWAALNPGHTFLPYTFTTSPAGSNSGVSGHELLAPMEAVCTGRNLWS